MKAEIYNALATLNQGFDFALESLTILEHEGVITVEYVQQQTEAAETLRAGINSVIVNRLYTREVADREHFDQMRSKTEERLKTS